MISPASPVYYARTHWAIERMLSEPAFDALKWTSLRPNLFGPMFLGTTAEAIKAHRTTGKLGPFKMLFAAESGPVAVIDPSDVGIAAGKLLALADPSLHASQFYTLNGPEDVTGKDVVAEAERLTGTKATGVEYEDTTWIEFMASASAPAKTISTLRTVTKLLLTGKSGLALSKPTSQAILELAPPKRTFRDSLADMVAE